MLFVSVKFETTLKLISKGLCNFWYIHKREYYPVIKKNNAVLYGLYRISSKDVVFIDLVVQWLRPCDPNAGGTGLISGQGTKILHTVQHHQKKKKTDIHKPYGYLINNSLPPMGRSF